MIKLRYNSQTGKVGNGYCDNIQVPEPFLLISEAEHDTIKSDVDFIYFVKNGKFEKQNKKELEEAERIAKLHITKLDFFEYVLKPFGFTYAQLQEILHANDDLNAAWQLCNHVYRGNEALNNCIFTHIPELTEEQLTQIFEEHCSKE